MAGEQKTIINAVIALGGVIAFVFLVSSDHSSEATTVLVAAFAYGSGVVNGAYPKDK